MREAENLQKGSMILAVILLALALGAGLFFILRNNDDNGTPPYDTPISYSTPSTSTTTPPNTQMVRNVSPAANTSVRSPLTVTGEARGNWFFEASFPIRILDANGRELGVSFAQAEGEWMTTDFVPFRGTVSFATSTTPTGTLVLEKDNPSGLPQNTAEVKIPIRFSTTVASKTPIQDAIRALLAEWNLPGVTLEAASLNNGILTLTFSDPQFQTSGGAARVTHFREQIETTAKRFPGVNSVRLMPNSVFQP